LFIRARKDNVRIGHSQGRLHHSVDLHLANHECSAKHTFYELDIVVEIVVRSGSISPFGSFSDAFAKLAENPLISVGVDR
jgi:hypothetical protein